MIIEQLEEKIKGKGIRIVLTEGWDPRVQKAAIELKKNDIVEPVLLGEKEQIEECAKNENNDLNGI